MESVKNHLEILKKAQELDRDIYQASQQLLSIPEERVRLQQELDREKAHLRQLEDAFKQTQLKQKKKEGELAEKEGHVKKLDGQLGQVKTNKEYSALQQEIASLKADNSILEEEIIKVIDEVEAAEEEVKKEQDRLKQVEKEFGTRNAEIDRQEKAARDVVDRLKSERGKIIEQVPPDVRSQYDILINKKQGLALVPIQNENCGACQLKLRPQLINEVQLGEQIVLCENCSRILYI